MARREGETRPELRRTLTCYLSGIKGLKHLMRRGRCIPAGLFGLLLWIQASFPSDDLQRIQTAPENLLARVILSDAFLHCLGFGLLALLIWWGLHGESRNSFRFGKVVLLAFGFGVVIEAYQGVLPWRAFGLDDLVWNTVVILLFLLVLLRASVWSCGP